MLLANRGLDQAGWLPWSLIATSYSAVPVLGFYILVYEFHLPNTTGEQPDLELEIQAIKQIAIHLLKGKGLSDFSVQDTIP